jgi:DNA-directed RNA polymerase specialized sigma24 family protein
MTVTPVTVTPQAYNHRMGLRPARVEAPEPPEPPDRAALKAARHDERRRLAREAAQATRAQHSAQIAEQSRQALALRSQGLTYQQIAGRMGVGLWTAYDRVGRALGVD